MTSHERVTEEVALDEIEVIIPNLKKRYSGGTAVNRTIAPLIARRCRAVWFGLDRPDGIAGLGLGGLLRLRFRPPKRHAVRIWHARRNTEMLLGLVLKTLGWRLALIFNSAGQRRHSRYTAFLIGRMDEVIATSEISASFLSRPATVIHHGIDLETYRPPADRPAAFAATGLPGKYGIGTFGRVRRQKGSDLFVEAMCRLLPKYPDFTAVVVGHVSVDNLPFVEKLKQQDRRGRPQRAHPLPGRIADRGGAALVPADLDLCVRLARRRFWPHHARGDGRRRRGRGHSGRGGGDGHRGRRRPAFWRRSTTSRRSSRRSSP